MSEELVRVTTRVRYAAVGTKLPFAWRIHCHRQHLVATPDKLIAAVRHDAALALEDAPEGEAASAEGALWLTGDSGRTIVTVRHLREARS